MERFEKFGYAIFLLLILIITIPKISQNLIGSTVTVAGVSANDFTLLSILLVSVIGMFWLFFGSKPDFSTASKKFRKLYNPKSDMQRLRQYIKEQKEFGVPNNKIMHSLLRVGWDQEVLYAAFGTADRAKVIKVRPSKIKKRRIRKRK